MLGEASTTSLLLNFYIVNIKIKYLPNGNISTDKLTFSKIHKNSEIFAEGVVSEVCYY
jgi:hypothetical protein